MKRGFENLDAFPESSKLSLGMFLLVGLIT